MRRLAALVVLLGFFTALAAQPPGSFMFGGGSPKFPLFFDPTIKKELALTDEQNKKVQAILDEFHQGQGGEDGRIVIRIGPGGGGEMPDFKKIESDLLGVLDDKQKTRFNEIWLQRQGRMAWADERIAKELGLADEQKDLIKDILESHQQEIHKIVQEEGGFGGGGPIRLDGAKVKELREKTEKSLAEIASKDQEEKWQKMLGKKFEAKRP